MAKTFPQTPQNSNQENNMENILIVEDDEGIRSFVQAELEHEGFGVNTAATGREALSVFESTKNDIILLDIMLPQLSGLEVLRRIRKTSEVPVILVTARGETFDKVNGLDAGADDYLAKPFEIEELLARVRAILRRAAKKQQQPSSIKIKNLTLNTDSMEAMLDGNPVELSKTEYLLLKTLMKNANKVMSRDQIISEVWGDNHYIEDNAVDVYIRYLRNKIDRESGTEFISTVRGAGYIIRDSENLHNQ